MATARIRMEPPPPLSQVGASATKGRESYCYRREQSRLKERRAVAPVSVVDHREGALQYLSVADCEVAERHETAIAPPALMPAPPPDLPEAKTERGDWNRKSAKRKQRVVDNAERLLAELGIRRTEEVSAPAAEREVPVTAVPGDEEACSDEPNTADSDRQQQDERLEATVCSANDTRADEHQPKDEAQDASSTAA